MLRAQLDGNAVCITTHTELQKAVPERSFEVWLELTPEQIAVLAMALQEENNLFEEKRIKPVIIEKPEGMGMYDFVKLQKELQWANTKKD